MSFVSGAKLCIRMDTLVFGMRVALRAQLCNAAGGTGWQEAVVERGWWTGSERSPLRGTAQSTKQWLIVRISAQPPQGTI